MKWIGVLPFIYPPYYEECVATMHPDFKKNVLFVDNTINNLGIMRSHNLAVDKMLAEDADWLVVISAAIRFGKEGGMDFIEQLDPESINISAANKHTWAEHKDVGIYGWHLIAFSRECINRVGKWDANFSPYGWDDIDYSIRMQKAFPDPQYSRNTKKVAIDAHDTTMAHSIHLGNVKTDNEHHIEYMKRKWNYDVGVPNPIEKMYDHPFNDETKELWWWPTTKEGDVCR